MTCCAGRQIIKRTAISSPCPEAVEGHRLLMPSGIFRSPFMHSFRSIHRPVLTNMFALVLLGACSVCFDPCPCRVDRHLRAASPDNSIRALRVKTNLEKKNFKGMIPKEYS